MKKIFFLTIPIILFQFCSLIQVHGQESKVYGELKNGFQSPPAHVRPKVYYWWLNGNVDTVRVKEEIAAMDKAGISGFDIFEIGVPQADTMVDPGPAFLSEKSLQAIKVALEEAKKYQMDVGLNMASSWNAGGAWITPQHSAKSIYFSKTRVNEKSDTKVKLPFPEISEKDAKGKQRVIEYQRNGKPVFYKEVAVVAVPIEDGDPVRDPSKFVDLSDKFDPEKESVEWTLTGDWEVHRYICSNSGEQLKLPSKNSVGPIIDHFDADATEAHFLHIINKVKEVMGDNLEETALKSLYLASYEATGFVWTLTLPQVFEEINGYEITPYLPVLFNEEAYGEDIVSEFKKDHQRTLSELMINNFYKKGKEIANAHGLMINSESGGPGFPLHNVPVEPLKSLGVMDLPRGEFWINHRRLNADGIDILRVVKEVSSASHIYGRGIVEEEAFTSFKHWQEGPFDMKPSGDRAFAEGMNRVVVHGFSHNPRGFGHPGIAYHAGTHYNDRRVWFSKSKPFNDYLARNSFLFQETKYFADVLYYYGDQIPNYTGHKNSRFTVGPGYDYEVTNTEILLQLKVSNGKMVLPTGGAFSVLVLEGEEQINPKVLLKIEELLKAGVVIVGPKPESVLDLPGKTPDMASLINKLWSKNTKNRVIAESTAAEVLNDMGIEPDLDYSDKDYYTLDFIHYQRDDLDFYFVRNTTDQWISRNASFRQKRKVPEIWDPGTGEINPISIYHQEENYIKMPLSLPPFGAQFVVFKPGDQKPIYSGIDNGGIYPPRLSYTSDGVLILDEGKVAMIKGDQQFTVANEIKIQPIDGAWEVNFSEEWGAPEKVVLGELKSWTDFDEEGIKYYSGIARYKTIIHYEINSSVAENQSVLLDLGEVSKIGEVWLNGEPLGICWTKPFQFDVTEYIKPGDNVLEIEVANTWSNRMVGDRLTEGKDYTYSNIQVTSLKGLDKIRFPWAEVPLIESGLLGPVKLITLTPLE